MAPDTPPPVAALSAGEATIAALALEMAADTFSRRSMQYRQDHHRNAAEYLANESDEFHALAARLRSAARAYTG